MTGREDHESGRVTFYHLILLAADPDDLEQLLKASNPALAIKRKADPEWQVDGFDDNQPSDGLFFDRILITADADAHQQLLEAVNCPALATKKAADVESSS